MDYYELGKWLGDRRGFPRAGIVNTELALIKDTASFLEREFNKKPIFKVTTKADNPKMFGEKVYETFIVSSEACRVLEQQVTSLKPSSLAENELLAFLAGFIDAEGTIDLKNKQIVISIGKKSTSTKDLIKEIIENIGWSARIWECEQEWKVSIKENKKMLNSLEKFIKHPKKINLLQGQIPDVDKKYLEFIKSRKEVTARKLSVKFNIHIDSARRILRFFSRLGIVERTNENIPYQFTLR